MERDVIAHMLQDMLAPKVRVSAIWLCAGDERMPRGAARASSAGASASDGVLRRLPACL